MAREPNFNADSYAEINADVQAMNEGGDKEFFFHVYQHLTRLTSPSEATRKQMFFHYYPLLEATHFFLQDNCSKDIRIRQASDFHFDEEQRTQGEWERQINSCFLYRNGKGERIKPEDAIQRHLYANKENYLEELGGLVGYEVNISKTKGAARVDLLSIKDDDLCFIELKKCTLNGERKGDNQEPLIRAILEMETFRSYLNEPSSLKVIKEALGVDFKNIRFIALVPELIARDMDFIKDTEIGESLKGRLLIKTIKVKDGCDLHDIKVGNTSQKYFEITDRPY
ncbi:MAG: hypothetical protein K6F32_00990 [Bacilli bacterium]|nr:hypothetical protein [Bacilli bacterium]